jgi:hypothetical protein
VQLTLSLTHSGHTLYQLTTTMDTTTVKIATVETSSLNAVGQKR